MSVFVATHSDRAKPLGLQGEYDLKEGFAIVRLFVTDGQRQASLDTGNGESSVILPGPFYQEEMIVSDAIPLDLEPEPSPIEAHILELHEQGESFNEICRQVWGHTGGKQVNQIKQVIERYK